MHYFLTGRPVALREGIADKAGQTNADGNVISHVALGVDPAQAGTRVLTLAVDAGLVRGAVGVDDTLRPAVGRGADHFRQT